jgi:glycosyltransferase involved in cell wall biosynthesis
MNILLVTEYFPRSAACEVRGGVEARSFYLARELARRHSVRVICTPEPGDPPQEDVAGVSVHRCGPARPYGQAGFLTARVAFIHAAVKLGRQLRADIVDGFNFIAYVAAYHISRSRRIPRVATYHDVWLGEWVRHLGLVSGLAGEVVERYVLSKRWDRFIANSETTRQELLAAKVRAPAIDVVYNGIALDDFATLNVPKFSEPTLCYVGRLVRYKRVDDLLRATLKVREAVPGLKVKIVGSGPDESRLQALAKSLGLGGRVEFLGFVPKHRFALEVMARSHVVCLPSAVEGFGMVVVEAMACGTPVVASALLPIREITREGLGALLFECGNVPALAERLTCALTDEGLRARYAEQGRRLAREYDWRPLAAKVETVYQSVLRS